MKTSFWTIAAAALLLAGCSKEELTESISDGASAVATRANARPGDNDNAPTIRFTNNRIVIGINNTKQTQNEPLSALLNAPNGSVTVVLSGTTPPTTFELPLERVGNSKFFRTPQSDVELNLQFELVDLFIDDWQGESLYSANVFVYPSGRTVQQDPHVGRIRTRSVTNFDSAHELTLVVNDDPSSDVAEVRFVQEPFFEDPTDPTTVTEFEPVVLQKTHFNQALGLSRWTGIGTSNTSGSLYLNSGNSYDVDFLSEEANARIIAKYNVSQNEDGSLNADLSDEPELLGTRLGSTSFGEQWQLEIAIADLGDWVETVNYVFEPGEGPAPFVSELPMQLTRTDGNLRVYTSGKFSFNGNPIGNDVGGIVYIFGSGNRGTAVRANSRTELL